MPQVAPVSSPEEPPGESFGDTAGRSFTVRVPATAANLGPGYDCFGLALGRFDQVTAAFNDGGFVPSEPDGHGERAGRGLRITVEGVGAADVPRDSTHLVVRSAARSWAAVGLRLPDISLHCRNSIPHGGGQGSSAAAIVAGLLVGRALLGDRHPAAAASLTDAELLRLGTEMEGHPDNVAPALLGGFTLAWVPAGGGAAAVRRSVHPDINAVMFTAAAASATCHARALLPAVVPHAEAAANSAAAALLVHAMTVDPDYLFEATRDHLHQKYRASSMPGSARLMQDLRSAGIPAVISGAGPSVLVLTVAQIDREAWQRTGFEVQVMPISDRGAELSQVPHGSDG